MFSDPVRNLKAFGLTENNIVADLGAGTGYYAVAAGQLVPRGKVYAVEVVKEYLSTIKNKCIEAKLGNVECLWGNIEKVGGTKIGDSIVDRVIISNILFQIENKDSFLEEIRRILKTGGKVLLIDWAPNSPLATELAKTKTAVSKDKAREMFEMGGFKLEREIDAGEQHYGMIFIKN